MLFPEAGLRLLGCGLFILVSSEPPVQKAPVQDNQTLIEMRRRARMGDEVDTFADTLQWKHGHNPHGHTPHSHVLTVAPTRNPVTASPATASPTECPITHMPSAYQGTFSPTFTPTSMHPITSIPTDTPTMSPPTNVPTSSPTNTWPSVSPFTRAPSTARTEGLFFTATFTDLEFYRVAERTDKLMAFGYNFRFAIAKHTNLPIHQVEVLRAYPGSTVVDALVTMDDDPADVITPHELGFELANNPGTIFNGFNGFITELYGVPVISNLEIMTKSPTTVSLAPTSSPTPAVFLDRVNVIEGTFSFPKLNCQADTAAEVESVLRKYFADVLKDEKVELKVSKDENGCAASSFVLSNLDFKEMQESQEILTFQTSDSMFKNESWTNGSVLLNTLDAGPTIPPSPSPSSSPEPSNESANSAVLLALVVVFVILAVVGLGVGAYCTWKRKEEKKDYQVTTSNQEPS
mmetsp:Transcript_28109/g.39062  ORF Transcript_28109/g.39062 Transcript_28109/m.39062 type:complete len:462 (-) Transcript_28109:992-2377(-)